MKDEDYVKASSRWLFEINFLNNDYVKTALLTNVYNVNTSIKDVELLVDQHNKRMLIYLALSFWGRLFRKRNKIANAVEMIINDALPSYELRVIYDIALFEKAVKLLNPDLPPPPVEEEKSLKEEQEEEDLQEG